ncbi:BCL5p [Diaporthe helianthi]|uniref:BCL5p n=1 Tax=Diaporthe helianthi TaxID=158607 RepID=A0A2P5HSW3_DIAHE|nr:BCL5p [Diaporthe helianthi]
MGLDGVKTVLGWGPAAVEHQRIPTDEVLPMHHFDDLSINRSIILAWIYASTTFLTPRSCTTVWPGYWRLAAGGNLGADLEKARLNNNMFQPNGKLEIHVPSEFTPERPAVRFSQDSFGVSFAEHPLASQMPNATSELHIYDSPERFRPFVGPADTTPGGIDDYLYTDTPQLGLHVVTFLDATLVSLNWPHNTTDGFGRLAIVQNWCKVLAGKEDEVAPFMGTREDPMASVGTGQLHEKEEPYALKDRNLGGLSLASFVVHSIWDSFWVPEQELRTIFLPAESLAALRREAAGHLSETDANAHGATASNGTAVPTRPFISDGDILAAWLTQITCRGSGPSSRPLAFSNAFELRSRLPDVFNPSAAYVGNFVRSAVTQVTADEARFLPLGQLALRYRQSLRSQATEGQVRGLIRFTRELGSSPVLPIKASSTLFSCSNWAKARFFDVIDFAPAVVRPGPKSDIAPVPGRPVYFHCISTKQDPPFLRNVFNVLGEDHAGNYWLTAKLPPAVWENICREMKMT